MGNPFKYLSSKIKARQRAKLIHRLPPDRRNVVGVTMGWDAYPTTAALSSNENDPETYVLSRRAEKLLRAEYYPNGPRTWPCSPETGERLPNIHSIA